MEGSLVHIFCQSEKPRGNIFFFFLFFFKLSPCKSDFTVGLRNHIDVIDILNWRIYEISVSPHRLLSNYRTKSFSTNKFWGESCFQCRGEGTTVARREAFILVRWAVVEDRAFILVKVSQKRSAKKKTASEDQFERWNYKSRWWRIVRQ